MLEGILRPGVDAGHSQLNTKRIYQYDHSPATPVGPTQYRHPLIVVVNHGDIDGLRRFSCSDLLGGSPIRLLFLPLTLLLGHCMLRSRQCVDSPSVE